MDTFEVSLKKEHTTQAKSWTKHLGSVLIEKYFKMVNFAQYMSPGIYVKEQAENQRYTELANHIHIYLFGTATAGDDAVPVRVRSLAEFRSAYGEDSPSDKYVQLIFENDRTALLYFVRIPDLSPPEDTILSAIDVEDNYAPGFLIAPELFETTAEATERKTIGDALINLAESRDYFTIIDPGADIAGIDAVKTERGQYQTQKGHAAFYYPYLLGAGAEPQTFAPSAAIAAVATRRIKEEGLRPPAGAKYPIRGVTAVAERILTTQQDELNPEGINVIRNIRNLGIVVWGMRTLATEILYRFVHYRIVMNVVNYSFRRGMLEEELFDLIDGENMLMARVKAKAVSIGRQLFRSGLLYGTTEDDAYAVVCDFTNNTLEDLQKGDILVEFYAAIAPALEKLLITSVPVTIGRVGEAAANGIARDEVVVESQLG